MANSSRSPALGVHLLETITRGLYANPLHCVREYVQNSYDSIRKARREGILEKDEGEIKITISMDDGSLLIRDNGTGLSPEEAVVSLIDLGMSEKAKDTEGIKHYAGFRGIGRVSGITHCKQLRFDTSNGDGQRCIIEFNAEKINKLTERGQTPTEIEKAISDNCKLEEVQCSKGDRYFEVQMIGITQSSSCLDDKELRDYLARVAPVNYDPSKWPFAEDIIKIAKEHDSVSSLGHVKISIQRPDGKILHADIRRNLKKTFSTSDRKEGQRNVSIKGIRRLPIDGEGSPDWWGWLAEHEREGQLRVPFSGIRIRVQNIEIGDHQIVSRLFPTPSLAVWCVGEIHITGDSITPNAGRDGLEDSPGWKKAQEYLKDEARRVEKLVREESKDRNRSGDKLIQRTERVEKEVWKKMERGFVSHDEKTEVIRQLEKEHEKLTKQSKNNKRSEVEQKQLLAKAKEVEKLRVEVQSVKKTGTDDALQHLDRRTRSAVIKIFKVLRAELPKSDYRRIEEKINESLRPGKRR